ncbi:uracil-DNA glycosylase [Clostridium sp. CAG:1219]|nr:uracil-DNA glycosylase [Clostridium sp. CAG:1219]
MNYFKNIIEEESKKDYYKKLHEFVINEYNTKTIFPPKEKIFNALKTTPYDKVKVVIIGQDPYHGIGEAHGMCFSVNPGIKIPPSLMNIYKELNRDLGCKIPNNGYLVKWAKQGVLLLNSVLTVEKDKPASHQNKGWEIFTDRIIEELNKSQTPIVFLLWGNFAKQKARLITNKKHLILTSSHPSPFSVKYGFEGCSHFSKANKFLVSNNLTPIDWQIDDI